MSLGDNPFLQAVRSHADCMLQFGRGPEGGPLFACTVDGKERQPATCMVPPPPGVRMNDFSWAGSNFEHDVPFLETLAVLSKLTGDGRYADAAEDALAYFLRFCPYEATGLWPAGTHAQWSFHSRRALPNSTLFDPFSFLETNYIVHEQQSFVPRWFWDKAWSKVPEAVTGHMRGLKRHIVNEETFEHNRHAALTENDWQVRPAVAPGKDFARTAGFLIFDWAFAYAKSGETLFVDWARRKLMYHMHRRKPDGVIKGCIRTPREDAFSHHHSLSLCVYDAATVLGKNTAEGREFMDAARDLMACGLEVSPESAYPGLSAPESENPSEAWRWGYGSHIYKPLAMASVWSQLYGRTGSQACADLVVRAANLQMKAPPPPRNVPVLAYAFWVNLTCLLDAFAITGEERFLDRAADVGEDSLKCLASQGLVHGVSNMEYHGKHSVLYFVGNEVGKHDGGKRYYFNCTGTPHLIRSLLRLALLQEGVEDLLGQDEHLRIA